MLTPSLAGAAVVASVFLATAGAAHCMDDKAFLLTRMTAVDGRTLESESGKIYRLHAIAVPGSTAECADAARERYDCTELSRRALEARVDSMIRCTGVAEATATSPASIRCQDYIGRDIGATLVANGWAIPDRQSGHGMVYAFEAMQAEAHGLGLWQGRFHLAAR